MDLSSVGLNIMYNSEIYKAFVTNKIVIFGMYAFPLLFIGSIISKKFQFFMKLDVGVVIIVAIYELLVTIF